MHFVSAACRGERCNVCTDDATHKVGEEFFFDDPNSGMGHNMTAYICCYCFGIIMGTKCLTVTEAGGPATRSDAESSGR